MPARMDYGDANYAVLLNETSLDVASDGTIKRRLRRAIRVLTRDGEKQASAIIPYSKSITTINSLNAWLIRPDGSTRDYKAKDAVDAAAYQHSRELAGESRVRVVMADGHSTSGVVFGYEAYMTEKSEFSQQLWSIHENAPVETARLSLSLPAGWKAHAYTFNRDAPLLTAIEDRHQVWLLEKIAKSREEAHAPSLYTRSVSLGIDLMPPPKVKLAFGQNHFPTWSTVATHFAAIYESASQPNDAIKARAASLTANAGTSWERMSALARHAQQVNYISIALDLARGGGMKPRPASQVLATSYGDCKDKSTFLRSMLQTQGFESFPVLVYSGDADAVRPEWVSPLQFNHVILGIRVTGDVNTSATITHPELGRLLLFDPTNEFTPLGLLPREVLDGHALVLGGKASELFRMPAWDLAKNRIEREVTAKISAQGTISGRVTEISTGLEATAERRLFRQHSESEYREKVIKRWIGDTIPNVQIESVQVNDDFDGARFTLTVDFEAANYGKRMRDTLLLFKPALIARQSDISFKDAKNQRTLPIVLKATAVTERTEIALPAGFRVDEIPNSVSQKTAFGSYAATMTSSNQSILIERAYEIRDTTVPVSQYDATRAYFEKIIQAEQAPVVLKRL